MPYALFENEYRLSRAFPTENDVWRCADDCGLVVDDPNGEQRLEAGYSVKPCAPDAVQNPEPASGWMMRKNLA